MAHWTDELEYIVPELSVRARNILQMRVSHATLFLEMSREQIHNLRNCGAKTVVELVALQEQLLRNPPLQYDLFENQNAGREKQPAWAVILRKSSRNLLYPYGWVETTPDKWDLEEVLRSTYPGSNALQRLADAKVEYWCTTTGNSRRDAEALERTYLEFQDLPFAARLCGLTIGDAKKRVRPQITVVERVRSRDPASLREEIDLLLPDDARARHVMVRRALPWGDTLEELGKKEGVTRERIRQIEAKATDFARNVARASGDKLGRLIRLCQGLIQERRDLSRNSLVTMITDREADPEATIAAIALLGGSADMPQTLEPVTNAAEIISSLPDNSAVTVFQCKAAERVPVETIRELRRVSRNAGAIQIDFARERLNLSSTEDADAVIRELGFTEVYEEWYANVLEASDKRNPIANSAGKIIAVSGPTPLAVIWEGAAKHVRRLKHTLAPPSVIHVILQHAGFAIDGEGTVRGNGQTYELSGAEVVYVETIDDKFGGCASFWDLYDAIVVSGKYSLPTLSTVLLRTSSISVAIENQGRTTLYGVRGRSVDERAISRARQRQPDVASDASLSHTLNGFVIDSSVTTWMLASGVLTLPSNADIPEENWDWTTKSEEGMAVTSETFLYGFSGAMRDLGVTLGDKVRFSFDVVKRQIQIRTIQGDLDE